MQYTAAATAAVATAPITSTLTIFFLTTILSYIDMLYSVKSWYLKLAGKNNNM